MVLAVLEAHGGLKLGQHDVYLNVAGGLRIGEPAADLAAAAALISSLVGVCLPQDAVYFGEIALSGAVRAVGHSGLRLKEAGKLGFAKAFAPSGAAKDADGGRVEGVGSVASLVADIAASGVATKAASGAGLKRQPIPNSRSTRALFWLAIASAWMASWFCVCNACSLVEAVVMSASTSAAAAPSSVATRSET